MAPRGVTSRSPPNEKADREHRSRPPVVRNVQEAVDLSCSIVRSISETSRLSDGSKRRIRRGFRYAAGSADLAQLFYSAGAFADRYSLGVFGGRPSLGKGGFGRITVRSFTVSWTPSPSSTFNIRPKSGAVSPSNVLYSRSLRRPVAREIADTFCALKASRSALRIVGKSSVSNA